MKKEIENKRLIFSAIVGALYATLTLVLAPVSYGPIQFRVSEALCILPFVIPETSIGLFIGCIISNIFSGNIFDIIFGSLATLIAGILTSKSKNRWIACLWPVIINALVIGAVISFAYGIGFYPVCVLEIAASEAAVVLVLGLPLLNLFQNKFGYLFDKNDN